MPSFVASLRPRLTGFFGGGRLSPLALSGAFIGIALFFCAVTAVASIGGDFPLNDDWAYGESTRVFLQSGRLYLPTACAAGFAHIFWGSLFAKLFGFSYVVLRYATILAGAIGAYLVFLTLVELGIHRRESLFCALVYAGNPIMINLYLGFMSDIPALTLSAAYFFFLLVGLRRSSLKYLALSLLLLILAITIRQSSVVLALAAASIMFSRIGTVRQRLAISIAFLAAALFTFWAVDAWLMQRDATGQSIVDHYSAARTGHRLFVMGFFQTPLQQCFKSIAALGVVSCYLGLFAAPITIAGCAWAAIRAIGLAPDDPGARKKLIVPALAAGILICLLSAYYETSVQHALMPFCENILRFSSVGAQSIMGIANPLLTPRQKIRLTVCCYLLAGLLLTQLLALALWAVAGIRRHLALRKRTDKPVPFSHCLPSHLVVVLASVVATFGFLTVETIVRCTDRYYLIALLPAVLATAYLGRIYKLRYASTFGALVLLAGIGWGLMAGQDYMSSNAARWRALSRLEAQGVSAASIDGGAEYNVLRDINVYASHYRGEHPRDTWRWWPIRGEEYIVSFSPVPDYQEKWQEKYFSALTMSEHPVYVLERLKLNK